MPISEIHWNVENISRLVGAGVLALCTFQMLLMISNYWLLMVPLRKEVPDVVAPPIFWTLAYHVVVMLLLAAMAARRIQVVLQDATWQDEEPTISGLGVPLLALVLTVVVSRFQAYYSRILRQERLRRDRPPPP